MEIPFNRREILLGVAVFVLSTAAGFGISGFTDSGPGDEMFREDYSITVNSSTSVRTVNFSSHSIDLMLEDSGEARVYLDYDRDGGAERELDFSSNGTERVVDEYVTLDSQSYNFQFRFSDNPREAGDAFLTLYRIDRVQ